MENTDIKAGDNLRARIDSGTGSTLLLIRDLETGLLFAHGKWTSEAALAQDFPDQDAIAKVVALHKIQNAEMVLFDGPNQRVGGGVRVRCP